jgi:alkaline phosphatase
MKKIVITMLVLLSAAYAVGIGGGEVARKLDLRPSQIVPAADTLPVRNLIYLIGDGMGLSHVSMLMLEEGYGTTAFDRAQNIALITTYSANNRVTDSAAAGTALATGHKTGNGMLGVLPDSTAAESIMADAEPGCRPESSLPVLCNTLRPALSMPMCLIGDSISESPINWPEAT